MELVWPSGGVLALVRPPGDSAEATWLGDRPGRMDHVAFAVDDPSAVPGAGAREDGTWELEPDAPTGTRVVLHRRP